MLKLGPKGNYFPKGEGWWVGFLKPQGPNCRKAIIHSDFLHANKSKGFIAQG